MLQLHFTEFASVEQKEASANNLGEEKRHHPAHKFPNLIVEYMLRPIGCEVSPVAGVVPKRLDPMVHLQSPSWSLFSGDSSDCFGESSVPAGFLPQFDTDKQ